MKRFQWMLLLAAVLVVAAGAYWMEGGTIKVSHEADSKPMRKAKDVNLDELPITLPEVDNEDAVDHFYERLNPSLKTARQNGLTVKEAQSSPVPGRDGRMQINEVWHNGRTITVMYSLDLSALIDKDSKNHSYSPMIESVTIQGNKAIDTQTLPGLSVPIDSDNAVIFQNRVYGSLQLPAISKQDWGYENIPEEVHDFDETLKTSIGIRIGGERIETEAMPIRYLHDKDSHLLATYETTESYTEHGVTFTPMELKAGVLSNSIRFRMEDPGAAFNESLEGIIQTNAGESYTIVPYIHRLKEGVYEGYFPPFSEIPDEVTFQLQQVHFKEIHPYSFEVDMNKFKGTSDHETWTANKKIAEIHDTDIILRRVDKHGNEHMNAELFYDPHSKDQPSKVIGAMSENTGPEAAEQQKDVFISSEDGKSIDGFLHGYQDEGNIDFGLHEFDQSDRLKITVEKVVYTQKLDHSFTFHRK
ncbi:hypothetical protein [Halobacillus sp. KGW1]|uniref:hypothetical protein n=1 Tax=Halobacillus sp. KGW1 TaxID=1793726 RepID=UPI000780B769|nr:hypothetical protein [Halobacillus sp. KGW1]